MLWPVYRCFNLLFGAVVVFVVYASEPALSRCLMAASKWLEAGFVMATFPMVDYSRSGKDVWNYAECASQVFMAAAMSLMAADSFLQTGGTAQTGFALLANLSILSVPVMVYMDHLWHRNEPNHRACPHEAAHQKKLAEKKDQAEEDGLIEGDGHEGGEQGDEGVGGGNAVLSDFDVDCQDGMAKEETPAVSRNPLAGWWGGSGNEDETAPLSPSTGGIAIELHAFTDSDEDGLQDDDMINIGTSMEVSLVDMALTHKEHAKVLEKVKEDTAVSNEQRAEEQRIVDIQNKVRHEPFPAANKHRTRQMVREKVARRKLERDEETGRLAKKAPAAAASKVRSV